MAPASPSWQPLTKPSVALPMPSWRCTRPKRCFGVSFCTNASPTAFMALAESLSVFCASPAPRCDSVALAWVLNTGMRLAPILLNGVLMSRLPDQMNCWTSSDKAGSGRSSACASSRSGGWRWRRPAHRPACQRPQAAQERPRPPIVLRRRPQQAQYQGLFRRMQPDAAGIGHAGHHVGREQGPEQIGGHGLVGFRQGARQHQCQLPAHRLDQDGAVAARIQAERPFVGGADDDSSADSICPIQSLSSVAALACMSRSGVKSVGNGRRARFPPVFRAVVVPAAESACAARAGARPAPRDAWAWRPGRRQP